MEFSRIGAGAGNDGTASGSGAAVRKKKVVAIMGPTASGKSSLALRLAQEFSGEIISADSAQVYIGPDIGTAKPSREERAAAVHHLVDIKTLDESFSLAEFKERAEELIGDICARGHLPIAAGGTGLYLRGLLEGYTLPDVPPDAELRGKLNACTLEELLERLRRLDPQTYEQIDRCNKRRVSRALEVVIQTGRSFAELSRREPPDFQVLKIGLAWDRQQLYARIDRRLEAMLAAGWAEETHRLREEGFADRLRFLRILGYAEMLDADEGLISKEEAAELIRLATHRFAKRQQTWLKAEPGLNMIAAGPDRDPYPEAAALVRGFLAADDTAADRPPM